MIILYVPHRYQKEKNPQKEFNQSGDTKGLAGSDSGLQDLFMDTLAGSESLGMSCTAYSYAAAYCTVAHSLPVAHTRYLCYCLPLVREAVLQVCYLKDCTQAQLT